MSSIKKIDLFLFRAFTGTAIFLVVCSAIFFVVEVLGVFRQGYDDLPQAHIEQIDAEREVKEFFVYGQEERIGESEYSLIPLHLIKSEKAELAELQKEKSSSFYKESGPYGQATNFYLHNQKTLSGQWLRESNQGLFISYYKIYEDFDVSAKKLSFLLLEEVGADSSGNNKFDYDDIKKIISFNLKTKETRVVFEKVKEIRHVRQIQKNLVYISYESTDNKIHSALFNLSTGTVQDQNEITFLK